MGQKALERKGNWKRKEWWLLVNLIKNNEQGRAVLF
jgi:hypothetical protein